jgi:FtsZ-interacting cell division protein ZipA
MTSLQLGLIVAGVLLVVGVVIFNAWQERRIRRRIEAAFRKPDEAQAPAASPARAPRRVEPTLGQGEAEPAARAPAVPANPAAEAIAPDTDAAWEPPVEIEATIATEPEEPAAQPAPEPLAPTPEPAQAAPPAAARAGSGVPAGLQPDPDIECMITLQPAKPITAGALAVGLHARLGKPLRWFGRRAAGASWQLLKPDSTGEFTEVAACLLLADRTGSESRPLLEAFVRLVGEIAPTLPAAFVAPDTEGEAARAESLDRICADLDVQIGLTVLKAGPATITGTRLRGVAEAAGFRLAENGRFEWVNDETGAVLYTLQNFRAEPFTAETLRLSSTPGAVFVLDVPRVPDPVRVFDQMKLAARRMTQTLDAALVDDNRRPLDDAALAAIRQQVQVTANALKAMHIEPGTPRALALFGG